MHCPQATDIGPIVSVFLARQAPEICLYPRRGETQGTSLEPYAAPRWPCTRIAWVHFVASFVDLAAAAIAQFLLAHFRFLRS